MNDPLTILGKEANLKFLFLKERKKNMSKLCTLDFFLVEGWIEMYYKFGALTYFN